MIPERLHLLHVFITRVYRAEGTRESRIETNARFNFPLNSYLRLKDPFALNAAL